MKVERTLNIGICMSVIRDPDIFEEISEDGADVREIEFDVVKNIWLSITHESRVIGILVFKQMFNKTFDTHIHILHKYRHLSREAGKALIEWMQENMAKSLILTMVPVICGNVKNFLLEFDFKQVGILEKAWKKNGKQNDMWILTRFID